MKYFSQFMLFLIAVSVLFSLQYQYWQGDNGRAGMALLQTEIDAQQAANNQQLTENKILRADVHDLKTALEAVEEHARLDLGLIKPHETFVQLSTAPITHSVQQAAPSNPDDVVEEVPDPL